MKGKHYRLPGILIMLLLFQYGCGREEFNWGRKVGDIYYSPKTIFLGTEEIALIDHITDNEISFNGSTGEIGKITNASILVIGVTAQTPYGSLRKVTDIQNNGALIQVSTINANLTDAIIEGTINLKKKLLEKDFTLIYKNDGVLVDGTDKAFEGLAVTLDNFVIFNEGSISARFDGAVGISPELDITIRIQSGEIREAILSIALNKIDEITTTSTGGFSGIKEITVAEFLHSPIIVDSLVFIPEVAITCGFTGTGSGASISGVRQDRMITSILRYGNSTWSADPLLHSENYDFIKPQVTDNSSLKIYSGPEISIKLFGISIQTIKATAFYTLEADKNITPMWRVFIGTEGQNTIRKEILGLTDDFSSNIVTQAFEISNAGTR